MPAARFEEIQGGSKIRAMAAETYWQEAGNDNCSS